MVVRRHDSVVVMRSASLTKASVMAEFGNSCFCVFTRWDNGETEKLSPWDVEPISDDGNPDFVASYCCHIHTHTLSAGVCLPRRADGVLMHIEQACLCCAAQQPETEGGGIPVTADEMNELMYKPLPGEWGERSRDEECERIIAGIDQLITVGVCINTRSLTLFLSLAHSLFHTSGRGVSQHTDIQDFEK